MRRPEYLVECGPRPSGGRRSAAPNGRVVRLDVAPVGGNVHLQLHDITQRMAQDLPPVGQDLVELAAYVYAADQAIGRGSPDRLDYGQAWRRRLRIRVPVREPGVWRSDAVLRELVATLSFLTDDDYAFEFVRAARPVPFTQYLTYGEGGDGGVESVMLFSGGLDSLAGAVREAVVDRRRVALVSHRPVSKLDHRQTNLVRALAGAGAGPRPFHVPVLANKDEALGVEHTQRSRSFLFASLAAVVSRMFGLDGFRFYENGIVSCNLPVCAQVLGGRASRTTHPAVLNGFARLFGALFGRPFSIENPFLFKTRTDVIDTLKAAGCASLVAKSVSCAHTMHASTLQPHCGTCSQCVDRRLAAMAAGLTDAEDPPGRYRVHLLTGRLDEVIEQTMVERVVGVARELERLDGPLAFLGRFGEASRLLAELPGDPDANAAALFDLHRRHARQVNGVLARAVSDRFRAGGWEHLPPTSLLRMLGSPPGPRAAMAEPGPRAEEFIGDKKDWSILNALAEAPSRTMIQVDLEAATDISRGTVSKRLRKLSRYRLTQPACGERGGVALTPEGRALVQRQRAKAG